MAFVIYKYRPVHRPDFPYKVKFLNKKKVTPENKTHVLRHFLAEKIFILSFGFFPREPK